MQGSTAVRSPTLKNKTDKELMEMVVGGESSAFAELVNRYSCKYYGLAYRMILNKNDAEDVVQEAFLKLWNNPGKWEKSKNVMFSTWFYRVVINLALDCNKKKKTVRLDEKIDIADNRQTIDNLLDKKQKQQMLDKYILDLPERQQIALNLCFYEELSNKEAAEILDIRLKALQSLLVRAKNTLKKKMKKHFTG